MYKYVLHDKVIDDDANAVKKLIELKANLDELDDKGNSPLHWAVLTGNIKIVRLLLESGANPNIISLDGFTPAWSAIDTEAKEIEALLVLFGGKVVTRNKFQPASWLMVKKALDGKPMPEHFADNINSLKQAALYSMHY